MPSVTQKGQREGDPKENQLDGMTLFLHLDDSILKLLGSEAPEPARLTKAGQRVRDDADSLRMTQRLYQPLGHSRGAG